MSDTEQTNTPPEGEQSAGTTQGDTATTGDPTPSEGESTAPQVDIIAPPEPDGPPPEPVGRTPEAESGQPPSDESQGVGVAPTEPGDVDAEGRGGNTVPRPSSDFEEDADDQGGGDAA